MKSFLIILFSTVAVIASAQSKDNSLEVKDVYYISVDIYSSDNHPILFDILMEMNDTLLIDTINRQVFLSGILRSTKYVPRCWDYSVFQSYYNDKSGNTLTRLRNSVCELMETNSNKLYFKLGSGEHVYISFIEVKGVFCLLERQISFSKGLDIDEFPQISTSYVPLAISDICLVDELPITTQY